MYNFLPQASGEETSKPLQQLFEKDHNFQQLQGKSFLLDNFIEDRSVHRPKRGVGAKTAKKHFQLPAEEVDFNLYMPLHELWKEYVTGLLEGNYSTANIAAKLTKADMHGAMLSVWKASCASYPGHKGIVIQETRRSFRVVTPGNKVIRRT